MSRFAVVILNWNGADDTIQCLRSIRHSDPAALPIVIDNGSTDDSVARITDVLNADHAISVAGEFEVVAGRVPEYGEADVVLVHGRENLGFAGGCNRGLELARRASLDVSVFLNNDTVVEPHALTSLVQRLRADAQWFAVFPLLMIHGTDRIWNCGGEVSRLGFRRYNYAAQVRGGLALPPEMSCSFFTGCCFAVRTETFASRNGYTERFFFGEEDFELALWMKDQRLRALCLTDCVVHHKVSASLSRAAGARQASKVFVHYLNRFIHMRLRFGMLRWWLWLAAYSPYLLILLMRKRIVRPAESWAYLSQLIRRSAGRDRVTREDFEAIMKDRVW